MWLGQYCCGWPSSLTHLFSLVSDFTTLQANHNQIHIQHKFLHCQKIMKIMKILFKINRIIWANAKSKKLILNAYFLCFHVFIAKSIKVLKFFVFRLKARCNAVVYNNMHAKSYAPQAHNSEGTWGPDPPSLIKWLAPCFAIYWFMNPNPKQI